MEDGIAADPGGSPRQEGAARRGPVPDSGCHSPRARAPPQPRTPVKSGAGQGASESAGRGAAVGVRATSERATVAHSRVGAKDVAEGAAATLVAASDHRDSQQGLDPNTSFVLKINLVGNRKKARQDVKCFSFDMDVDLDLINFKDLVESIVEKYPPRYLEVAHVQYYDEALKTFPEIKCDQELMTMFSKHWRTKVVLMFILYCGPSGPFEPITEWDFDVDDKPENSKENDEDDYLRNPLPKNEHVGVDEESMYLEMVPQNEPINALQVVPYSNEKEKDPTYVFNDSEDGDDDSEDGDESEDEGEAEEDLPCNEGNHAPSVEYDLEDPPMVVGSTYPSMKVFKLEMSQHAIKHQFEYNIAKSGPKRFRAYCSRKVLDKCPWWIYASTTADGCTVKVKKILVVMTVLVLEGQIR